MPAEPQAQVADDESVPFGLLETQSPSLAPPDAASVGEQVTVCFVRDGRLVVMQTELAAPVGLNDAVAALGNPPATDDVPVRTAVTDVSVVREVRLRAGIAQVDFRQAFSALGGDDQLLAIAQIVCTLTARPGVGQVSFTLESSHVDVPRGDGSFSVAPVSRDDYGALLP